MPETMKNSGQYGKSVTARDCKPTATVKTAEATASYLKAEVSTEGVMKLHGSGGSMCAYAAVCKCVLKTHFDTENKKVQPTQIPNKSKDLLRSDKLKF